MSKSKKKKACRRLDYVQHGTGDERGQTDMHGMKLPEHGARNNT